MKSLVRIGLSRTDRGAVIARSECDNTAELRFQALQANVSRHCPPITKRVIYQDGRFAVHDEVNIQLPIPTMCLLLRYIYTCHPAATETLFRPCHTSNSSTLTSHISEPAKSSQTSSSSCLITCARLWEKQIMPPRCIACLLQQN